MTAKEYLSQLITMDNAINRKQQRLMTLRDVAMIPLRITAEKQFSIHGIKIRLKI